MFFLIDSLFQSSNFINVLLLIKIIIYCLHNSPITYTGYYFPIWLSVLEEGEECNDMIKFKNAMWSLVTTVICY